MHFGLEDHVVQDAARQDDILHRILAPEPARTRQDVLARLEHAKESLHVLAARLLGLDRVGLLGVGSRRDLRL